MYITAFYYHIYYTIGEEIDIFKITRPVANQRFVRKKFWQFFHSQLIEMPTIMINFMIFF